MIPAFTLDDPSDLGGTHPELSRHPLEGSCAVGMTRTDFSNLLGSELGSAMGLSTTKSSSVTASDDSVSDVVCVGADVKAFGEVHAWRVVAAMQDMLCGDKIGTDKPAISPAMSSDISSTSSWVAGLDLAPCENSIPLAVGPSSPRPAAVGATRLVNFCPEAGIQFMVLHQGNVTGGRS